jgi:hypothetical protein
VCVRVPGLLEILGSVCDWRDKVFLVRDVGRVVIDYGDDVRELQYLIRKRLDIEPPEAALAFQNECSRD